MSARVPVAYRFSRATYDVLRDIRLRGVSFELELDEDFSDPTLRITMTFRDALLPIEHQQLTSVAESFRGELELKLIEPPLQARDES